MTETTVDKKSERVAKHSLLDKDGNVVENEEEASGIRYVHIETGETLDYQSGLVVGETVTVLPHHAMFWNFGAKTLATNEASAIRNGKDPDGDQVAAIKERFNLIFTGKWVDRTREGVGVKIDKAALATAVVNVTIADGNAKEEQRDALYAVIFQKLEEDKGFVAQMRQIQGVPAEYAKLVGKTTKTSADLMAQLKVA
jgi:hypothetical protein